MIHSRMPQVGDLIIQNIDDQWGIGVTPLEDPHSGVVTKIVKNHLGHMENVFIQWQTVPMEYNPRHGYSGTNIHNLRKKFRLFRSGQELL